MDKSSGNADILKAVAKNKNANATVLEAVANNEKADATVLEDVAKNKKAKATVLEAVANNEKANANVFDAIVSNNEANDEVKRFIEVLREFSFNIKDYKLNNKKFLEYEDVENFQQLLVSSKDILDTLWEAKKKKDVGFVRFSQNIDESLAYFNNQQDIRRRVVALVDFIVAEQNVDKKPSLKADDIFRLVRHNPQMIDSLQYRISGYLDNLYEKIKEDKFKINLSANFKSDDSIKKIELSQKYYDLLTSRNVALIGRVIDTAVMELLVDCGFMKKNI